MTWSGEYDRILLPGFGGGGAAVRGVARGATSSTGAGRAPR